VTFHSLSDRCRDEGLVRMALPHSGPFRTLELLTSVSAVAGNTMDVTERAGSSETMV
jgi:hypothetical protein